MLRGLQMFLDARAQPTKKGPFIPNTCPFCGTQDGDVIQPPGWVGACSCPCGCTWRTEQSWVRVILMPPTRLQPPQGDRAQKYMYFLENKRHQTPSKLVVLTEEEFQMLAPCRSDLAAWGGVDQALAGRSDLVKDCQKRPDLDELTVRETRRIAASPECLIVVPSPERGDY